MATKTVLNWNDSGYDNIEEKSLANPARRFLGVDDEVITSEAELPEGMTIEEALADYASGYDAGSYKGETTVSWVYYHQGEQDHGRWTFDK